MGSIFSITGRLYGNPRSNIRRGVIPEGNKARINFTVGTYDSYRKEMEYFYCVAFGGTAARIAKYYTAKRCISIQGRIGNSVYNQPGKDKPTRTVQFVVTSCDFPTDGDGVISLDKLKDEEIALGTDIHQRAKDAENETRGAGDGDPIPEDPADLHGDDLPF